MGLFENQTSHLKVEIKRGSSVLRCISRPVSSRPKIAQIFGNKYKFFRVKVNLQVFILRICDTVETKKYFVISGHRHIHWDIPVEGVPGIKPQVTSAELVSFQFSLSMFVNQRENLTLDQESLTCKTLFHAPLQL